VIPCLVPNLLIRNFKFQCYFNSNASGTCWPLLFSESSNPEHSNSDVLSSDILNSDIFSSDILISDILILDILISDKFPKVLTTEDEWTVSMSDVGAEKVRN
jgi:hypothetical protein